MGRKGSGVEVRSSSIRLSFTLDGELVRRTVMLAGQAAKPTAANVKYATRLAAEIRERIRLGTFSMAEYFPASGAPTGGQTVGQQLDDWLGAQRIEASTKAGYESAIRFWKPALGETKPLRVLKHSEVLRALADRADLSGKTINNYVSVLREALKLAVRDGLIETSPADGVPRAARQAPEIDPFTREEAEKIIATMPEGQVRNFVEFRFFTGMRTSELMALAWEHVDLASGYVVVKAAKVRGKLKGTKTGVERQVRLNSRALAALQLQRAHTQVAGGAVFQDPRYAADWDDERAFRRSFWSPALKRLGIRYRRPYCTRHTYATMMLKAGMKPGWCAKQLGHSVEMFLRVYSRWIDEAGEDERELARFEATMKGTGT